MMQEGRILRDSDGTRVDVKYELFVRSRDNAGGFIRIDDDPHPAAPFMEQSISALLDYYVLETSGRVQVKIFFNKPTGQFTCVSADQAREA